MARHPVLTDDLLDKLVADAPLEVILQKAMNLHEIDVRQSFHAIEEDLFSLHEVPTETARRALETLTEEPNDEIKALLIDLARKSYTLRELALEKAGCPDMVIEPDLDL